MREFMFTYEPKDYSNYNKDTLSIKRIVKFILKVNAALFIIISLIMSLCFTSGLFGGVYLGYWAFYVVLIVTFIVAYIFVCYSALASQFLFGGKFIQRQQQGICKNVKLIISDEAITYDNGYIQSVYKWNSVKDLYNKKHSLLIFIADLQAIIIPKRIFNSDDELCSCWEYLQTCYKKYQNNV